MINGIHAIIYSKDADKVRRFFHETLDWKSVDAGQGWLIFALPPAEIAAHPAEDGNNGTHELFLMCDDINKTIAELRQKKVEIAADPADYGWGIMARIEIPGGGEIGLYQPKHPVAADLLKGGKQPTR